MVAFASDAIDLLVGVFHHAQFFKPLTTIQTHILINWHSSPKSVNLIDFIPLNSNGQ